MSHAADCSCCAGLAPQTPVDELNPPGQQALHYRVGTHGRFLKAQLSHLSAAEPLRSLTTRDPDDPALALLDAWSAVLDVLGFYQGRNANEGFLRTASERRSVLELGRAIGYELRPGVAASTHLAFTLETAPGAPLAANIPVGTKVQSVPGQDEKEQVFETLEAVPARAAWNALQVAHEEARLPHFGLRTLYLRGQNTRLAPGDALLVVGDERKDAPGNDNWDFRQVVRVLTVPPSEPSADASAGYTVVTLDRGLGSEIPYVVPAALNARCFALRAKATLFGQSAADWRSMPASLRASFLGYDDPTNDPSQVSIKVHPEWPDFSIGGVSDPPVATKSGTGLYGEYFVGKSFGAPKLTRVDKTLSFEWVDGSPDPSIPSDGFCVRWTGWLEIPTTGNYTFYVTADDGVRFWLDGKLLIDEWHDSSPIEHPISVSNLQAGRKLAIKLEYYENGGQATLELGWTGPGIAKQVIPAQRLYPSDAYSVHLDASYPKWVKGSWVVLSVPEYQELYEVLESHESGRAMFALSSKTTRLDLRGENLRDIFDLRLRDTSVYGESSALEWATRPLSGWIAGHELTLASAEPDLLPGRWLALSGHSLAEDSASAEARQHLKAGDALAAIVLARDGARATLTFENGARFDVALRPVAEIARVRENTLLAGQSRLSLEADLANEYLPSTLRINANVASASHGDSRQMRVQPELLGSGDGNSSFQRFQLRQAPLTYVSAATPSGIASTLQVRVDGVLWDEAPLISQLTPQERSYLERRSDDANTLVQFGSGEHGARLPSGQLNVTATYRVGIGAAGNVDPGKLSLLLSRPLGVKAVVNPVAAAGGTDPEPRSKARSNAPLTVLTLDRIVSLTDFEDFAAAFAGVGKAQAVWLWNGQERLVHVTISGVDGLGIERSSALYRNLASAIDAVRPKYQPLRLEPGVVLRFGVDAKLTLDPARQAADVMAAVRAALLAAFGFASRDFAQSLSGSEVLAVLQRVPGVVRVDLDELRLADGSKVIKRAGPDGRLEAKPARYEDSILPAQLLIVDGGDVKLTEQTP